MSEFDEIFDRLPDEFGREHIDPLAKSYGYGVNQLHYIYRAASSKYRNMGFYWNKNLPPRNSNTQRSYIGSGSRFSIKL